MSLCHTSLQLCHILEYQYMGNLIMRFENETKFGKIFDKKQIGALLTFIFVDKTKKLNQTYKTNGAVGSS